MLSKKYFQQLKIGEKGCQERFQLIERRRKNQIENFARYQNFQFDFSAVLVTEPQCNVDLWVSLGANVLKGKVGMCKQALYWIQRKSAMARSTFSVIARFCLYVAYKDSISADSYVHIS